MNKKLDFFNFLIGRLQHSAFEQKDVISCIRHMYRYKKFIFHHTDADRGAMEHLFKNAIIDSVYRFILHHRNNIVISSDLSIKAEYQFLVGRENCSKINARIIFDTIEPRETWEEFNTIYDFAEYVTGLILNPYEKFSESVFLPVNRPTPRKKLPHSIFRQ